MHRAETCRAKQERLNKPTIEPRLEIQTKSVVVCATYERTHSQATSELVVRQANFQKGRSVPDRPFSYGVPAIGVWFRVVAAFAPPIGFPSLTWGGVEGSRSATSRSWAGRTAHGFPRVSGMVAGWADSASAGDSASWGSLGRS